MGHKTMIDGTAYGVSGGKTMVDGTVYGIAKGRTMVEGTGYDVPFTKTVTVTISQTVASGTNADRISYLTIDGTEYRESQVLQIPMGTVVTVYAYFGVRIAAGNGTYYGYIKRNDTIKYSAAGLEMIGWKDYAFSADNDLKIALETNLTGSTTYGTIVITDLSS